MFKMSVNKKRNVVVEMDEVTFEAVMQTIRMAVGDNIPEGFTPEKQEAIYEVDRILYETFYKDREAEVNEGDKFVARFQENGEWVDVFPGMTGDYEWAQKVAASTWERNGVQVTPCMMRVYKI